jgi:hypothetical protein
MRAPHVRFTVRRMIGAIAVLLFLVGGTYTFFQLSRVSKPVNPTTSRSSDPQQVRASEIGHRVQIVGDLGKPLGELMTIRGHWIKPPPGETKSQFDGWEFAVTVVNGTRPDQPVRIKKLFLHYFGPRHAGETDPLLYDGDIVWELRGYEEAIYGLGTPVRARQEYDQQLSPEVRRTPVAAAPFGFPREYGFYCYLVYVSARRISP